MDSTIFDNAAGCLPDECFKAPPDLGIILGSGWGDAIGAGRDAVRIPYSDIKGLGGATVAGHAGEFVMFERGGKRVAAWREKRAGRLPVNVWRNPDLRYGRSALVLLLFKLHTVKLRVLNVLHH